MKPLILFFRFWYDFFVGDCWQIAAGIALFMIAGIVLMRWHIVPDAVLPLVLGVGVLVLVPATILLEVQATRRSRRT